METKAHNYIDDLNYLFKNTQITGKDGGRIVLGEGFAMAVEIIMKANAIGNKVIFIGNGGSAAVASHKALDYWFQGKIRGLAFSDHANLTCVSNDFGYQNVFVKQIEMFADKGDVLAAISSSGNSENIVLSVEAARHRGLKVLTFTGFKENNRLRPLGDLNFYVPSSHYNKVESLHLLLCDCILEAIVSRREEFLIAGEHFDESEQNDKPSNFNHMAKKEKNILVAVDRDGTLISDDDGYFGRKNTWKDDLQFYGGAVEGLKTLSDFAKVIVATNQIGVARGLFGQERVKEINQHIDSLLKEQGVVIDGWYFCPYVEKSWAEKEGQDIAVEWVVDGLPETRKPNIGMLKMAALDFGKDLSYFRKIFVVGDSLDDISMALNAGGVGVFFRNGENEHLIDKVKDLELKNPGRVFYANNFLNAAEIIKQKSF